MIDIGRKVRIRIYRSPLDGCPARVEGRFGDYYKVRLLEERMGFKKEASIVVLLREVELDASGVSG